MRIGHASRGSGGRINDPIKGDNDGKEVCFSTFNNKRGWNFVLRAKDKNVAERMALACEAGCMNDSIGYCQARRNSLRTQAKLCGMNLGLIKNDCDCDCSSFMSVCAECAGVPIPYTNNNAPTTSTMRTVFMNTGYFDLLTDKEYLTDDKYLRRGDILVKVGEHTIMILDDGVCADISKKENKPMIKAVDISEFNIVTDYAALAKQITHIIIRVGRRGSDTGSIVLDKGFEKHIKNCVANKIPYIGVYFYDQSINEQEAIEQANWVMEVIKPYPISLPIYIDNESTPSHTGRGDKISKEQRTKNVIAFCNRILELGHTAGIYSGNSWFTTALDYNKIKNYHIWCARYNTVPPTISNYDIWQYGSEQFIWAQKPIDVNWIYKLPTNTQKPQNGANTGEIKGNTKKDYNYDICNKVEVSDFLNMRLQPLPNSPVVGKLYNGNKVDIYGYTKDWYMLNLQMNKWASSKYISSKTGKTTTKLNYRENAGTNYKSLGIYESGTVIKLLNKKLCEDGYWYLCLDDQDRFGWCSGKYISI